MPMKSIRSPDLLDKEFNKEFKADNIPYFGVGFSSMKPEYCLINTVNMGCHWLIRALRFEPLLDEGRLCSVSGF